MSSLALRAIDVVAPESRESVENISFPGMRRPREFVGLRKDESRFPGEVRARMLPYKGQMVRVSIVRDLYRV